MGNHEASRPTAAFAVVGDAFELRASRRWRGRRRHRYAEPRDVRAHFALYGYVPGSACATRSCHVAAYRASRARSSGAAADVELALNAKQTVGSPPAIWRRGAATSEPCGAPPQRTMDIGSYSDGAPEHTAGSASEEDEKLSWRSDPLESHSDWTVVVKVERDAKQAVSEANSKYTVHKNTLGFGPRKSEYFFATIFQTNLKEGAAQESELDRLCDELRE
ncbi:hypothetical protein JL722_640 [Aureococcus anophagefferens]|nr:hypothetical protein JL722_640 [Aureococcus anophagefferens]